jgi:hypothetical protein
MAGQLRTPLAVEEPAMLTPKSLRFRFSLKALFAVPLLLCVLLAWWRMPFTIRRPTGSGYRHTTVQREWDGTLHCCGKTTIYYDNGRKCLEYNNFAQYKAHCVNDYLMPDLRCWDRNGREMSIAEAFERRGIKSLLPVRTEYSHHYGKRT